MSNETSPRFSFGFRFSVLARQWRRALDGSLAVAGLTDASWAPMIHLQEAGEGLTQKQLALLVGVDNSSLVRLLDILARRGFIERRVAAQDRRARLIYMTEEGRRAAREIRTVLSKAEAAMLADVSDAELAAMLATFDKIASRMSEPPAADVKAG